MENWRYDITHLDLDPVWKSGFESYDDAYDAMIEKLTELVDEMAEEHPELTDQEIEESFDWEVRED